MSQTKKVIFRQADGYRTVAATGVWGGPSPIRGHVVFDFVVDRNVLPEEISLVVDELTGTATGPVNVQTDLAKESIVGVVLNAEVAYQVGKFLVAQSRLAGYNPPAEDE